MAEHPSHHFPCYHYKSLCFSKSRKVLKEYYCGNEEGSYGVAKRNQLLGSKVIYGKLKLFNVNDETKVSVIENLPCTDVMLVKDWRLTKRIGESEKEMKDRQAFWECIVYIKHRELQMARKYLTDLQFLGVVCGIEASEK